MNKSTVLVVDDDAAFRELVVEILASESYRILEAADAEGALKRAAHEQVDLVLTDERMPGLDGLELARRLRAASEPPAVVLMSAHGTIPHAVEAMRIGAVDYLTKPIESPVELRRTVARALGRRCAAARATGEFLTRDPPMLQVLALADRAAATDAAVMIQGESGTGKELLAWRIHRGSLRANGSFVPVNCAALPDSLAESELFGHERGAYTGAQSMHRGVFEQAHGGSLFLDEVSELSEAVQGKLLRAVEQKSIRRLGASRLQSVDVRLICATNRDLAADVAAGRFREDLFYRLCVVTLSVPPLRERSRDLELLIEHLRSALAQELGVPDRPLSTAAIERLQRHWWPGNVRELRNVLERGLIAATGDRIDVEDLPLGLSHGENPRMVATAPPLRLEDRERAAILDALEATAGNRRRAADLLGVSVRTLYNRLRSFGIG
jgi:two-component system response regulator FlrC